MKDKVSIIYLLGAGRSGTTLLATVLNNHPNIQTLGEMHQFLEYLKNHKLCSCGLPLNECPFWGPVVEVLNFSKEELLLKQKEAMLNEQHRNIPGLIIGKKVDKEYFESQNLIFETIHSVKSNKWLLDSSKYIARYLLLKKGKKLKVKGIYMVRDVRGVINSFSKNVQTPRNPVSTLFYYTAINFFGQLVCWLDKEVIKIKYEEFVANPIPTTVKIYSHIFESKSNFEDMPSVFQIPHIIGGNRMKKHNSIEIKSDDKWKVKIPRYKQIIYYLISLPFMLINHYKI